MRKKNTEAFGPALSCSFLESEVREIATLYEGKRVVVAGGTGMIGREIVTLLHQAGADLIVTSIEDPAEAGERLPAGVHYVQFDWSLGGRAEMLRDVDVVLNLIGRKGSVGIGESKAASYLIPMLRTQTNLMESAHEAGVSYFLFVSSLNVYPRSSKHFEDNAWDGLPMQNDRIPGIGKRVGEMLGLAFELEYGWDAVRVMRPSNVYGPYDSLDPTVSHVIPSLIRKMLLDASGEIEVWGDGSAIRDFIYSKDCAFWLTKAAIQLPPNVPTNLGSGKGVTIRELAQLIRSTTGYPGRLVFSAEMPTGDPVRLLDMERARELLGWKERTPLEYGLNETISWARRELAERGNS